LSKSLVGAEILDVGTWPASTGQMTISESALESLIASFAHLGLAGRVPLKFGHNDIQPLTDGQPALGWVSRVYRQGSKLLADFSDVPDVVFEAIRKGLYKFVSVELLKNVQAGTRVIPWVLDAVSLLGADQPAVGTLKDLQSLTLKRGPQLRASARVAFKRDTKLFSTGAPKGMEKHEVEALLAEQAKTLTANFTSQLAAVKAENATALEAERVKTRTAEIARHRDAIKAKFETAIKAESIKPAVREQFYRLTRIDTDAVMEIKAEDADAFITENADKAKLARKPTSHGSGSEEQHAATNAEEVTRLSVKDAVARGFKSTDYNALKDSTRIVLGADKKLARAYIDSPDGAYSPQEAQ
jgi:hypothetical protein